MAIAQVQLVTYNAGPVANTTFTIPIAATAAGNFLAILYSTRAITITATDNLSNIYTVGTSITSYSNFRGSGILYLANIPSGITSITLTLSSPNIAGVSVIELSGVDTVSPVDSIASVTAGGGPYVGPSLVTSHTGDVLFNIICTLNLSGTPTVDAPWIEEAEQPEFGGILASLTPGSIGTFAAVYHNYTAEYCSSGIALSPVADLTLSLSDSVVVTDSLSPAFNISQNLSDSITVSDSAPNSFSVQSNYLVPVTIPIVEQLVNQLVPANIKTYFKIVE
jgi:hypothetical protein